MKWTVDGALELEPGDTLSPGFLERFFQDPKNPILFRPRFNPCKFRRIDGKVLPCGKVVVRYECKLLNTTCSVEICKTCTKREA